MMSIKLDWERLQKVYQTLVDNGLAQEADLLFLLILSDGSVKKAHIKFKEFMKFFWEMSENTMWHVIGVSVQDKEGRILYRHKQVTNGNEEIPVGGNVNVLQHWPALTVEEKETYIRMLIAQIQGYEK